MTAPKRRRVIVGDIEHDVGPVPDYLKARCIWCDHAGVIRTDLRLRDDAHGAECVDGNACDARAFAREDAEARGGDDD